ncbi:unnamed protein product [Moneuplotes crassus]|uniref:Uncharacterized protein n=1 Tax=Euplotes crassus TaxID=5936 RepID=A0AAD1XBV6_EUPCR|nr:unnamed protein product [Moneuplotes crassus]
MDIPYSILNPEETLNAVPKGSMATADLSSQQTNKEPIKLFSKAKVNGTEYHCLDVVKIKQNEFSTYVAKILKIMSRSADKDIPCAQVQWYYKKGDMNFDILRLSEADQVFIGDNEVFPTNHKDIIPLESIICKVQVLHLSEYQDCSLVNQSIFYTRAKFDVIQNRLFPPFSKWDKLCICEKPQNPNMLYIGCEMCDKWVHPECVGIKDGNIEDVKYYCNPCKKKKKREKKLEKKKRKIEEYKKYREHFD